MNARKKNQFAESLKHYLSKDLREYENLLETISTEHDLPLKKLAAALAYLQQGRQPFALKAQAYRQPDQAKEKRTKNKDKHAYSQYDKMDFDTCRIEVGSEQGARKGDIVGAIANECDLDSQYIGKIQVYKNHSLVDLPKAMPKAVLHKLQKIRIAGTLSADCPVT